MDYPNWLINFGRTCKHIHWNEKQIAFWNMKVGLILQVTWLSRISDDNYYANYISIMIALKRVISYMLIIRKIWVFL